MVRRRPPARLESLKATKEQRLPSREECEEKMRLVEERRKVCPVSLCLCTLGLYSACFYLSASLAQLKENELKTRLRAKSARVRVPAPTVTSEADEDAATAPVAWTDQRISTHLLDPASFSQNKCEEADGEERARERLHHVRVERETGRSEEGNEDDDDGEKQEELTQVVELMHELCYSRCQSPEDKETL